MAMELNHHDGWFHSAAGFDSHQKQRDSRRLAATSKNPRNLFGLEASKIAHNLSLPGLRDIASGHFKMSYCDARNK